MSDSHQRVPRRRPPLRSTDSVMLRVPPPGYKGPEPSSQRRALIVDVVFAKPIDVRQLERHLELP